MGCPLCMFLYVSRDCTASAREASCGLWAEDLGGGAHSWERAVSIAAPSPASLSCPPLLIVTTQGLIFPPTCCPVYCLGEQDTSNKEVVSELQLTSDLFFFTELGQKVTFISFPCTWVFPCWYFVISTISLLACLRSSPQTLPVPVTRQPLGLPE